MNWSLKRLGDVATLQRGHDLPQSDRVHGDVPIVSSSGVTGWHNHAKAKAPGVVTGRYGTLGQVFFITQDYWPLNTALYVKDFKENHPKFVGYLLENILGDLQSDKAAVPGFNRNVLHEIKVRVPDSGHQERIIEVLSAYDDLIENNRRRMELLEASARQLYEEWFVRLRFPGHEHTRITNGVPDGWQRKPLSTCSTFMTGGTPKKSIPEYWNGDIPWISSGEMRHWRIHDSVRRVTEDGADNGTRMVTKGTILAVVRGMSLAKEFRVAMCSGAMTFNQDLKAIAAAPDVRPEYLFASLLSQREQIRDRSTEASHGTKKLDTAVLSDTQIIIPAPQLQDVFCDVVVPMHEMWDCCWNQNSKLKSARDILLPRLMSGEVPV